MPRRVHNFTLIDYDIPSGQAAAYYPETNPLLPLTSYGVDSFTPTAKFIAIRLYPSSLPMTPLSATNCYPET